MQYHTLRLLTGLLAFFAISVTKAQFFIGPTAGGQASLMAIYDKTDPTASDYYSSPGLGFHAGAMASMQVKKRYYLTGSIEYSQKQKVIHLKGDGLYKDVTNLHYIDVPIYFSLEFTQARGNFTGKGGKLVVYDWFLGAGPVVSYWLGGRGRLSSSYIKEDYDKDKQPYTLVFDRPPGDLDAEADIDHINVPDPNRVQFSINITGGMAFQPIGFQKIIVSAGIEFAQSFLSKEENAFIPGSFVEKSITRGKNNNLRVSVGYVIDTRVSERSKGKSMSKVKRKKK